MIILNMRVFHVRKGTPERYFVRDGWWLSWMDFDAVPVQLHILST